MNLKILVVDDDEVFAHMHRTVVKRSGCTAEVLTFDDGQPALDFLRQQSAEPVKYLMLLDINMPRIDGWQVLDALPQLSQAGEVWVVMATSSTDASDREKALQYRQVIAYIEKPLNVQGFKEILALPQLVH